MWPWEHAAVGYLLYSLWTRVRTRDPPSDLAAVAVLFGTLLPDLLDKPLSWGLGVFQTGYAIGHSVFVAAPVGVAVGLLAARTDRQRVGIAFVVGYWAHLAGDVLNPLRNGNPPSVDPVLWPVVIGPPYETDLGLGRGLMYFGDLFESLQTVDSVTLVVAYLLIPLAAMAVWVVDGLPGIGLLGRLRRRLQPK